MAPEMTKFSSLLFLKPHIDVTDCAINNTKKVCPTWPQTAVSFTSAGQGI